MSDVVLAGRLSVATAAAIAAIALVRLPYIYRLSNTGFDRLAYLTMAASRLFLYGLVFLSLGLSPQSDVIVYTTEGRNAIAGKIPFRDFFTAYSPLFPYEVAGALLIWDDARAIVLLSIVIEILSLPVWLRASRHIATETQTRAAALLFALSPLSIAITPLSGNNHAWLALFLALSLYALYVRRPMAAGLAFAGGICLVKWLSLVHAPVLWLTARRSFIWLASALLPGMALYAAWWTLSDGAIIRNAKYHAAHFSSGNLPFLLTACDYDLRDRFPGLLATIALLIALAVAFLVPAIRFRQFNEWQGWHMLGVVTLVLLLFSKKAFAPYMLMALFPLCLSVVRMHSVHTKLLPLVAFTFFNVVGAVESSVWNRWLDHRQLGFVIASQWPVELTPWHVWVFIASQLVLIGFYFFYLATLWRGVFTADD